MRELQQIKLMNYSDCGVLPQIAMNDDFTIDSVIVCDSLSGERDEINNMPHHLSLTKLDATGAEKTASYMQIEARDLYHLARIKTAIASYQVANENGKRTKESLNDVFIQTVFELFGKEYEI